jgi:1L-myo-inositol 1-phosphate cytidylyltransferase
MRAKARDRARGTTAGFEVVVTVSPPTNADLRGSRRPPNADRRGSPEHSQLVNRALVLAAGNGDRFQNRSSRSKLLEPVLGEPLLIRTLNTACEAGIASFEIVLGYQADDVRAVVEQHAPAGTHVRFSYNPDWHLENGVSVLAARARLEDGRFALLMGDHLFEAKVLKRLLRARLEPDESVLAIDSRPAAAESAAEATKVRVADRRIVAIGKHLTEYDALDTGVFVCTGGLFGALAASRAEGDTTLSGGIRQLAARGLMQGLDIGDAAWYDIDTVADLEAAETLLAGHPEHA